MRRRYSRVLMALAAATTATVLGSGSCSFGTPDGNHCWFICKVTEKAQPTPSSDGPLSESQAAAVEPA